jgi:hypothetical protein
MLLYAPKLLGTLIALTYVLTLGRSAPFSQTPRRRVPPGAASGCKGGVQDCRKGTFG